MAISRVIPACAGNTAMLRTRGTAWPGHPRVRGEHTARDWPDRMPNGSSPRARGTLQLGRDAIQFGRVIPACAGNTVREVGVGGEVPGHPRVRGEHYSCSCSCFCSCGSSPRARGTRQISEKLAAFGRVIPACAGNTGREGRVDGSQPGHPRVRGEHCLSSCSARTGSGSSPRARGTLQLLRFALGVGRVIPACAGNTTAFLPASRFAAGHPRVRGEHGSGTTGIAAFEGSSPRARGTLHIGHLPEDLGRVIPACAGNTRARRFPPALNAGHPRVRGEHYAKGEGTVTLGGSSPRARGTHQHFARFENVARVIPACAGNTWLMVTTAPLALGHPRVRGEHVFVPPPIDCEAGSSPRARGTQKQHIRGAIHRRVIPACAGNTTRRARAP